MRTSNKLLTALILVVFLTPLLLALNLKSRIDSLHYTVQPLDHSTDYTGGLRQGALKPYKVIKMISPSLPFQLPANPDGSTGARVLTCHLRPSDTASYRYMSYGNTNKDDSVHIYNIADTLFVEYVLSEDKRKSTPNSPGSNTYFNMDVTLYLPLFDLLELDGAGAVIDSLPANPPSMRIDVVNRGQLRLGESGTKKEAMHKETGAKTQTYASCHVKELSLRAKDAEVFLGDYFMADQLKMEITGNSVLGVKDALLPRLEGNLSDSIKVYAEWKTMRRLSLLTGH